MTPLVFLLLSSISFLQYGSALQVTPGSECAAFCLDNPESDPLSPSSSNTTPRDITCADGDYDSSATGIKFKNCLDCLQKSNATSETESDVEWFLYNIRYSVDVCLFGYPDDSKSISSPCNINWACQPLKKALEVGSLDSTRDQLEYCTADGDFTKAHHIDDCIKCLASSSDQGHLSNFMTALKAGCQQKPAPGDLIGLSGSLFTGSQVNITNLPTEVSSANKDTGFGITSTGAIVGISLGGGLLLIGGLVLFWIYHRRQKRAFRQLASPDHDPRTGNRSITPSFGGGLPATEKGVPSQMSHYELHTQRNFANNAEYYKMMEIGYQHNKPQLVSNPNNPMSGPQTALPTHPAYVPHNHSRQASRDILQVPRPAMVSGADSYTLQTYLGATDGVSGLNLLPPPPPGPPPAAATYDPSRLHGPPPIIYPGHSRDSSIEGRGPSPDRRPLLNATTEATAGGLNPPPPPPPPMSARRSPKVPSLSFPSVSRIRIPKKYTPPLIMVQSATPVVDQTPVPGSQSGRRRQRDIPNDLEISQPMAAATDEPRVEESLQAKRRQPPLRVITESTGRR